MSATADDTIVALASGPGRAAIAVIRLAGPRVAEALRRMCGALPHPRVAALIAIRHPVSGNELDRGLVLWFPGPRSFTGDDAAELHVHGGRAVVDAVLGGVLAVPGCRLAEPGEFTRRAFLNGKLDLAAVEGLADLIEAETDAQRRQALSQLDGVLGRWVGDVRDRLLEALALTESAIDFADEGDIATSVLADARRMARQLAETIDAELARPLRGERIRDGFVVTLAGAPNAGKSTLLNALARREVAIVSPHAGTTRDPIEVDLDLGGYAVRLIDTAGLRDTLDPVEQEGVARARARAAAADLVLWLDDVSQNDGSAPDPSYRQTWRLGTKADRVAVTPDGYDLVVSAHTGSGLDTLIARLERTVAGHLGGGETALVTRIRHRQALQDATATLARAGLADEAELAAEELRSAARALGRITGEIAVEEILGAIFSRFCIGK